MREYLIELRDIYNGIRSKDHHDLSIPSIYDALNFVPNGDHYAQQVELEEPQTGLTDVWPFPQFIRTQNFRLFMGSDRYLVYDSNWNFLHMQTYGSLMTEPWDFAVSGDHVIAQNGEASAWGIPQTNFGYQGTSNLVIPTANSVTEFRGQYLMCGFFQFLPWYNFTQEGVAWSAIGHADFTLDESNEAGVRTAGLNQFNYRIGALVDSVIVYGDIEVGRLTMPAQQQGFAYSKLDCPGVQNRRVVGISENRHIFIGNDNRIWEITDSGLNRLGYFEVVSELNLDDLVINFDNRAETFYLSDGTLSYCLNKYGMYRTHQGFSGMCQDPSGTLGYDHLPDTASTHLQTDFHDFGRRGLKTLRNIEFGIGEVFATNLPFTVFNCTINFRYEPTSAIRSITVPIIETYMAFPNITAMEFQIMIDYIGTYNLKLGYIKTSVQFCDRKNRRGFDATPNRP